SPDQRVDYQDPNNELKKHSDQIIRLAEENHIGLVDSYKAFEFSYADRDELVQYMSQVNHPNEKGHELITNEIIKWFEPLDELKKAFVKPPETSKPGVYWYFMDGNLSREEMTKDLESMKEVGINNLIFLEVGIGVPRGPVDFMSEEWQNLFVHAVRESERLGIRILMGAGPGWCGSGGPWVKPEESMKHLVFSETKVKGNTKIEITLPIPEQRSTRWHRTNDPYYEDVAVYAIPSTTEVVIQDISEKALYERSPYSSVPNVKPHLPSLADYKNPESNAILHQEDIMNISQYMDDAGQVLWNAPKGNWTLIRMGVRVTGAGTRPAPQPALGLESNKLDTADFATHLSNFTDILLEKTAPRKEGVGWTGFHMDSWESGSQNWTDGIVEEFKQRRGYNPVPYFLAYTGRAVESVEITERFLWDLRRTCQDLVLENHAEFGKAYAHKNGLELTIEPYDMNPAGDLDLGFVADVIMAEFWSKRFGYQTAYAVVEATSISHISGQPIVGAEVFTSDSHELWQEYPWSMKDQSDWALALGVNRFVYHTFAHKPLGDEYRPGMTMGVYGVHWDRGQTWWPMVGPYHEYISRFSHMMQQGQAVSDILYLTPEGAPMVFTPPYDAMEENGAIPDKKGYGFDGCSPKMLLKKAEVKDGKIVFSGASSYEIMVLPNFETMTPELLQKIISLADQGARIIGKPPEKSPSLSDYPNCDNQVKKLANELRDKLLSNNETDSLYPSYHYTSNLLQQLGIHEDFRSESNTIRYGHRKTENKDIYFIANRTDSFQETECSFRAVGQPELWIGTTGETRKITDYASEDGITTIPMKFFPFESFIITFSGNQDQKSKAKKAIANFPSLKNLQSIEGFWQVSFDPLWGGPAEIQFDELTDWTEHEMRGIKYYSGIAKYKKTFTIKNLENKKYYIDLGIVNDMARVKLNGKDLGVIWCAPWRIEISDALKEGTNELEIEVANRWVNRLLGDQQEPDADVRKVKFENGFMEGKEFSTGRYTFTTERAMQSFNFTKPLPSGLLGPVKIVEL
ncbi:MAG: glycosyl hydrolase, partial [Bacteroidota bacterium]|nr:glycosyl hydrolase [Bacteroidota bacterium]